MRAVLRGFSCFCSRSEVQQRLWEGPTGTGRPFNFVVNCLEQNQKNVWNRQLKLNPIITVQKRKPAWRRNLARVLRVSPAKQKNVKVYTFEKKQKTSVFWPDFIKLINCDSNRHILKLSASFCYFFLFSMLGCLHCLCIKVIHMWLNLSQILHAQVQRCTECRYLGLVNLVICSLGNHSSVCSVMIGKIKYFFL